MAITSQGTSGLDYRSFRRRLDTEVLTAQQKGPLKLRLDLLESFLEQKVPTSSNLEAGKKARTDGKVQNATDQIWEFKPGTLTIVDLSCPFVDESSACALFSICLDLFLESRSNGGRIVALDEAHKVKDSP